jgi:hypothetical protein
LGGLTAAETGADVSFDFHVVPWLGCLFCFRQALLAVINQNRDLKTRKRDGESTELSLGKVLRIFLFE